MEGFQQTATEQHDRVNGYSEPKSPQDTADVRWTPPQGESGGSDSCGATSVSELTDLQELKARESEDEDDREKEVAPASKGLKGDQKKKEKESPDQEENNHSKQNSSAASSYTGRTFISTSSDLLQCLDGRSFLSFFFFFRRPVPYLVALAVRTAASWPRRQHRVWDQCGV